MSLWLCIMSQLYLYPFGRLNQSISSVLATCLHCSWFPTHFQYIVTTSFHPVFLYIYMIKQDFDICFYYSKVWAQYLTIPLYSCIPCPQKYAFLYQSVIFSIFYLFLETHLILFFIHVNLQPFPTIFFLPGMETSDSITISDRRGRYVGPWDGRKEALSVGCFLRRKEALGSAISHSSKKKQRPPLIQSVAYPINVKYKLREGLAQAWPLKV